MTFRPLPHAAGAGTDYNFHMNTESPNSPNQVLPAMTGQNVQLARVPDFSALASILSNVVNISESGLYHEPSCPVCSSQNRENAEDAWRKLDSLATDRLDKMVAYFRNFNEGFSRDAVQNHFRSHIDKGEVELRKSEYIARLANLSGAGMATIDHVKLAMAAVMECLTSAGTIVADRNTSNAKALEVKSKMVTSLVKTWTDLLSLQAKMLGEMLEDGELVTIPRNAFIKVFDDALKAAKTKEDAALISSILNGLEACFQQ